MTTKEIADRLVDLLRQGQFMTVYDELFHTDAHHIEPQSEHFADVKGVAAIKAKDATMGENIAGVAGMEVGDAIVSKDYIALPYKMTVTLKDGAKWPVDELIVYKVENGKIMSEQFFY